MLLSDFLKALLIESLCNVANGSCKPAWEIQNTDKEDGMKKLSKYQKGQRYIKALQGAFNGNMKKTFISLLQEKTRKYYIHIFRGDDYSFNKFFRIMSAGIEKFNLGTK